MTLDLEALRQQLVATRDALKEQDSMSESDRAPVALDQDSVGRLSSDAMQVQAMAIAQQRRRQMERTAIDAALRRIEEANMVIA